MRKASEQLPFRMPSAALQTLGDLVELQRGFDLTADQRQPGTIPVIGGGGANGFHAVANVRGPNVAVVRSGSGFGNAWWVDTDFWAHNTIMFVKDFRGNDPKYAYYVLDWVDFSEHNSGGAQPSLNRNFIYPIPVHIPPLSEQRKIAKILSTWDEAIEKLEALRAAKERRFAAAAQRLLAPARAIGRNIPRSNWGLTTFGDVLKEHQARNNGLGPDDVVTVGKYAIRKQSEHFSRSVASKDQSNYWTISPGDFVYDPMSAYYGALGRYDGSQDGLVSPAYRVIRLRPNVHSDFMVHLLRTHHIRFLLETRSSQGNKEGKRRLLQRDEFASIEFNLPPIEVQREIARKLADFRRDVTASERQLEALTRQKRGLMQNLLTGEWRVAV